MTEEQQAEHPLPPLSDPRPPEAINGVPIENLYEAIRALKREADDLSSEKQAQIATSLMQERDLTLAIFRVLHESGLLKDEKGEAVPLPSCPPPMLPPGHRSWIYKPELPGYAGAQFSAPLPHR